ncbi:MAG: hypothetical protein FJ095_05380 [Deltaproteobacteria bacterium]|nr:hypothetical protein [Deltaproteobacteria bacterium]
MKTLLIASVAVFAVACGGGATEAKAPEGEAKPAETAAAEAAPAADATAAPAADATAAPAAEAPKK